MATTFRVLAGLAKWDRPSSTPVEETSHGETSSNGDTPVVRQETPAAPPPPDHARHEGEVPQFAYNIQIQLPATKDISVYNAIFKSIREHLL